MSIRSPLGLSVVLAALVLAQAGARAEPSAGTWTDPPAKSAAKSAVEPPEPPGAGVAQERGARSVGAKSVGAKSTETKSTETKSAETKSAETGSATPRAEPVKRKPVRAVRAPAPRRTVAARPVRRPEPVVRSATVRPVRVARPLHRDWPPAEPVYVAPRAYDPRDPRLERLWSAEEAGYLAVHGRHVAYPDGRTLRIYRPSRDDEDLD